MAYWKQSKSQMPKTSTGRGYGSKRQDERAWSKTKNVQENTLLSADELMLENKRREQEQIRKRLENK
jgi:hypothetical protein